MLNARKHVQDKDTQGDVSTYRLRDQGLGVRGFRVKGFRGRGFID